MKPKILIVDDLQQNLFTLEKLLQKLEVEVIQTTSPFEVMNLVFEHNFCLAIIDVQMPEMDGYELVELLRSSEDTAHLPVIFVSAIYSDEFYRRKGYDTGAVDFLSKPFNPNVLLSKVRIFLDLYDQKHKLQELVTQLNLKNETLENQSQQLQEQFTLLQTTRDELEESNKALSKLVVRLDASSQVGQQVTSILDLDKLLTKVIVLIRTSFDYYFVGIWLLNEAEDRVVLHVGNGRDSQSAEPGTTLPLDSEQSIIALVCRTGKDYLATDVRDDPHYQFWEGLPDTCSELAVPLQIGQRVIGVLDIQSRRVGVFDQDDRKVLQMLAGQIAIAIRNARLYDNLETKVRQRTARLRISAELSERLNAILNVQTLLSAVVNQIKESFGYYHAHIYLLNKTRDRLVMEEGTGQAGVEMKARGHSIPLQAKSLVARAARTGEIVLIDNVREVPDWLPNKLLPDTYSEMAVPIIKESEVIGILDVQQDIIAGLDEGDRDLLRSLANQIGVAITNARLYEDIAKANADKDKFFSIVAHDLKGPFLPLLGNAELLEDMASTLSVKDIEDMSRSIHHSARQVFNLLENLLQWSRMQMGRMEYQPEVVDLQWIAKQTISLLEPTARNKSITLQNDIPDKISVYADDHMLDTVIRNLTNNALKFTPEKGRVTISAHPVVNSAYVEVFVSDTGVGISKGDIGKLFQTGVHHSTSGTAQETGTGLGLVMCKEMVEMNGGQIWVESELGQGTTVKFTVPVQFMGES
jgi:signal transduction histidine kinase/DNA-binding response OmpR family regulator